ncbi:TadE/TadG family type IV pilus assembly protein [Sphingorhabdus sp.]|uniref:TadE/TadG family type IV pilus assembly protein n=1 Tax=Sphingorhabdus sp. TaxID=1902408 RepID=UPI0037C8717F
MTTKFSSNEDGVSILEFALIAPVVMAMMLGTLDIGHSLFVRATLDGAVQDAARSSSLEGATSETQQDLIDERVASTIRELAPDAKVTVSRRYYKTFSTAALARAEEVIEQSPGNLKCDRGESFMDANGNGVWDADGGSDGQGGARDIVIITFKVSYPRLFPMAALLGWSANVEMQSESILANQPYGDQTGFGKPVQVNCPSV